MPNGKSYNASLAKVDRASRYALADSLRLAKETARAKFDETVELAIRLGVDPRQADQNIRGTVSLPHGMGKTVRVLAFAKGDKEKEAQEAGADFVGITSTINTLVYKIIGQPSIKEPALLKGKKIAISRIGGVSDFSVRFGLDRWSLVPDRDVALLQVGGDPEALLALQNKVVDAAALSEPFATMAERDGYSVIADLSRLNIPFTHHGIGTRKLMIQERRDIVIRFLRSYLEGIYVFKTNRELSLKTLQKVARLSDLSIMQSIYDDYSQRLTPALPYPTPAGIQTIIDQLAKTRPQAKGLNPNDFIDASIMKEIEDSGFVKRLYAR